MLKSVLASRCALRMVAPGILRFYSGASSQMDKFLGKWKLIPAKTTGFDEWAEAMQLPEKAREEVKKATNLTFEITREATDTYKSITDFGHRTQEMTFKLGVPFIFEYQGVSIKTKIDVTDGKMVGEYDFGGPKSTSLTQVEGNTIVNEEVCEGVSQRQVFEKVE